jgi:hypothetical protein
LDLQARFDRKQGHGRMIYLLARKAYSEKNAIELSAKNHYGQLSFDGTRSLINPRFC